MTARCAILDSAPPSERLRVALMMGIGDDFTVEINAGAARALLAEIASLRAALGRHPAAAAAAAAAAADRDHRAVRNRWFALGLWAGLWAGLAFGLVSGVIN